MKPYTVLCVEDDRETQDLLRMILADEVKEWFEANDGHKACEILNKVDIDLVLLDINLPKLRGTEVLRRIRQRGKDVAVVVISGYVEKEDFKTLINYKADYFLDKPVNVAKLREAVVESLKRKHKSRLIGIDALTGVLNRQSFVEKIEHWMKQERKFTLMVIDLDNFKPINDRYGHLLGDRVLQEVARRLQSMLRKSDLVGRYGGDEFVVAVEGDREDGACVVQKIQNAFEAEIEGFNIGVSIGKAYFNGTHSCFEEIFEEADVQMYANKRQKKR